MYIGLYVKWKCNSLETDFRKILTPNFMKIRPVGADLFHADGRTDRHEEANSRFCQVCKRAQK